jgi:glycogen synthase
LKKVVPSKYENLFSILLCLATREHEGWSADSADNEYEQQRFFIPDGVVSIMNLQQTSVNSKSVVLDTRTGGTCRVLFVTARYFPHIGGVENHVYQVASRLARMGIDTTILTTDSSGQLPVTEYVEGVTIRRARSWPAREDYYFAPDIYRIITQEHWDIVHVQSYHTFVAPLAMLAALQAGVPYIVTFHGGGHSSRLRHSLRGVHQWLLRPLLARADRLVAIAEFEIPLFSKRLSVPESKFALIPNGADLPNIPWKTREAVDENLIVSIGRLERYKGHQRVIAAMPEILAHRPDVRLWIAGVGPYESELWALAHKLGVQDRIQIYGIPATERERMARELSKAALVMLMSEYETHPIAAIEALALGRPVLVADTSGLSELAQHGLAQAIPLQSKPDQVAEAVIKNLNRPTNVRNLQIPTWDDCSSSLLALYQDVTGRMFCAS